MESHIAQSGQLYSLLGWLDKNRKQIVSTSVLVILVGIVVAYVILHKEQKEIVAGEALSAVLLSGNSQGGDSEAMLKVAQANAGTEAAARALLAAAGMRFADGKVADAEKLFRQFLSDCGDSPLIPQAKYGLGVCYEALGKTNEAIAAYKEVVDRFSGENVVSSGRLSLARLYEAQGKLEQARDLYLKLIGETSGILAEEASNHLMALFSQHPSLRPGAGNPSVTPANSPVSR
jgi:predicted negative regulator of RcsB-dependent stress response